MRCQILNTIGQTKEPNLTKEKIKLTYIGTHIMHKCDMCIRYHIYIIDITDITIHLF